MCKSIEYAVGINDKHECILLEYLGTSRANNMYGIDFEHRKLLRDYLVLIRAVRADSHLHALLDTTHLQVQTVAAHCGIMDLQYFLKLFKKRVGKTPREYREEHKK